MTDISSDHVCARTTLHERGETKGAWESWQKQERKGDPVSLLALSHYPWMISHDFVCPSAVGE